MTIGLLFWATLYMEGSHFESTLALQDAIDGDFEYQRQHDVNVTPMY